MDEAVAWRHEPPPRRIEPPLRQIERALRRITERLPLELAATRAHEESAPRWEELEWRLAPAVAAMHGVSALLADAPRSGRPHDWVEFLDGQRAMSVARQRRIAALLSRIDEHARCTGLGVLPLKGAALCALGLYRNGERPMADVDLLVRAADADAAVRLLGTLGYRESGATWKHRAFDPPGARDRATIGEHADNPIKIDLHVRIIERLPLALQDLTDLILPCGMAPGLNAYPSRAALMLHVLAHTAGSMVHRGVRLIQLIDIARLSRRMTDGDWYEVLRLHGAGRRFWWAAAPLLLAVRYLAVAVPSDALAILTRDCPGLLRRTARRRALTDFSYSHARIDPAPGLVWTRSVVESCRYLASRVMPSSEQLAQLDLLARTEPWAGDSRWYAGSQRQRILRWITSRPTRTETMQTVRAALALRGPT